MTKTFNLAHGVTISTCRGFLANLTALGIEAPAELTNILASWDDLRNFTNAPDTTAEEIKAHAAAGTLTEKKLADLAKRGADEAARRQYVSQLTGNEVAIASRFHNALAEGAADTILDQLRPVVEKAAEGIAQAKSVINGDEDPTTFLDRADAETLKVWQGLPTHTGRLDQCELLVAEFTPQGKFPLIESAAGAGFINTFGLFFVPVETGKLYEASTFRVVHGLGPRGSRWFRAGVPITLNTVAEARERLRSYLEQSWDAAITPGRSGRMSETEGFVPDVHVNPYKVADEG
ncbi:hypothetical protein C8E05_6310 [Rhodococcus wratislaviensis]|uniref:Uncharacterized protein n=1 Tax=Rhodococcus wratislaviensis TaxID=44752 RepID=A0AB38FG15_RHOWR|nr:hypothetical protein [Rhodococcus wratislaviensis]REE76811.1 hypothetical protein C8E05_6310 [Rhodococcus wratislaviensis]SPZ40391.1 Uncharacterised protein [Rhodococcus wratislaviensis]